MSAIDDFVVRHGGGAKPIGDVVELWANDRRATEFADAVIVGGALAIDVMHGDGFRDQIPAQLRDAAENLAKKRGDGRTYDEVRATIREKLAGGDESVKGWINKIKGQIGEDLFLKEAGKGVRLADSGSQAGYDVIRSTGDELEFIQVKLRGKASEIIGEMKALQQRVVADKIISDDTGETVQDISWVVPKDIVDSVREIAQANPELADLTISSVGITAKEAADIVQRGVNAVGAVGLADAKNFMGNLTDGVTSAVAAQTALVGFLLWKGECEVKQAQEKLMDTAITSTAAFAAAQAAEQVVDTLVLGGPLGLVLGVATRQVVARTLSSRREFIHYNESVNDELRGLIGQFAPA